MSKPVRRWKLVYGAAFAAGALGIGAGLALLQNGAAAQQSMVEVPIFEVDPLWPKPIPNEGLLGMTIGVSVDDQDNVWIVHRGSQTLNNNEKGAELNPPIAACCRSAPPPCIFCRRVQQASRSHRRNGTLLRFGFFRGQCRRSSRVRHAAVGRTQPARGHPRTTCRDLI